jgi:signal transduction histidine kinase
MGKQVQRNKRDLDRDGLIERLTRELAAANQELALQKVEKGKRADELLLADQELRFQNAEKGKRADELILANQELSFQNAEKGKRADELILANQELSFQNAEKGKRADELVIANQELRFQKAEKGKRADELVIANQELRFQKAEKGKRADELVIANQELRFQKVEKGKRADELVLANQELGFQKVEKRKRARELVTANQELGLQKELARKTDENHRLQNQLQQSQKMESLGVLAGGVAHDMNNVLGAILGMASTFLDIQPKGTPVHEAFGTILKAASRGGDLVKNLLAFARKTLPDEQELDLNRIIQEEVQILAHTTLARIQLDLQLAPDLRHILGDASALTHAIMNLCINAVDAMPEQGVLSLCTRNVDNTWTEVVVEDNGTGMPDEVLAKAMDPFFTTKAVGKGTGLGLPMVYTTVRAHHGQMDIQSTPGRGTRVMLRFPASFSGRSLHQATCAAPLEAGGIGSMPTYSAQDALTVLVVDDDELIRASLHTLLDHLGHTIILTRSGEEALAKLEARFEPDIVILDMNMPGMGGLKTLPILRALLPSVPIILATGRVDQTAMDLASAYPLVTLLPKPFTMEELKGHLGKAKGR